MEKKFTSLSRIATTMRHEVLLALERKKKQEHFAKNALQDFAALTMRNGKLER